MSLQTTPPVELSANPSAPSAHGATHSKKGAKDGSEIPLPAPWFVAYAKPLIAILGSLIAVAAVWAVITHLSAQKAASARDAFYAARQVLDQESKVIIPAQPADEATPADDADADPKASSKKPKAAAKPKASGAFKKLDVNQAFAKSVPALKKVATDYAGTLSAFHAQMLLGNLYMDHGAPESSLAFYTAAVEEAPRPIEKLGAWAALAQAQESTGKCGEAVKSLERAINLGVGSLRADLLVAQARCYETLKDSAKAKATYDAILKEFPGSPFSRIAEIYRAKIQ